MNKEHSRRNRLHSKKRKAKKLISTNINNLFNRNNNSKREFRENTKSRQKPSRRPQPLSKSLRFGAINIDGLDLENCVEVEKFLAERDFDVSTKKFE